MCTVCNYGESILNELHNLDFSFIYVTDIRFQLKCKLKQNRCKHHGAIYPETITQTLIVTLRYSKTGKWFAFPNKDLL